MRAVPTVQRVLRSELQARSLQALSSCSLHVTAYLPQLSVHVLAHFPHVKLRVRQHGGSGSLCAHRMPFRIFALLLTPSSLSPCGRSIAGYGLAGTSTSAPVSRTQSVLSRHRRLFRSHRRRWPQVSSKCSPESPLRERCNPTDLTTSSRFCPGATREGLKPPLLPPQALRAQGLNKKEMALQPPQ